MKTLFSLAAALVFSLTSIGAATIDLDNGAAAVTEVAEIASNTMLRA